MTSNTAERDQSKRAHNRLKFHLTYCRSLDGIRGVAILLVLFVHGQVLSENSAVGFIAVNTFFVLSGYLITCLLVEEWDGHGSLNFRYFYTRRALRLLPALLTMLGVFLTFAFLTDPWKRAVRESGEALRALFYFTNWAKIYHIGRNVSLLHTWSLSIEEQFYLIWPMLLWFGLRSTTRKSLLCWIVLGIFFSVLARIGLSIAGTENLSGTILPLNPDRLVLGLDTRADALLCGCFAGVAVSSDLLPESPGFRLFLKWFAAGAILGLIFLATCWPMAPWMVYCGWLMASIFAMGLITFLVSETGSILHRVFGFYPIVGIGKISYGLYVWHFPVLLALHGHGWPWKNLLYLAWVFPLVIACFFFVEKPCLRLKSHFKAKGNDTLQPRETVCR